MIKEHVGRQVCIKHFKFACMSNPSAETVSIHVLCQSCSIIDMQELPVPNQPKTAVFSPKRIQNAIEATLNKIFSPGRSPKHHKVGLGDRVTRGGDTPLMLPPPLPSLVALNSA